MQSKPNKISFSAQLSLLSVSPASTTKKMPRILFVSGFHPATRARDLAYEFERYISSLGHVFLYKFTLCIQVWPSRSLRRPSAQKPQRHPQSVSRPLPFQVFSIFCRASRRKKLGLPIIEPSLSSVIGSSATVAPPVDPSNFLLFEKMPRRSIYYSCRCRNLLSPERKTRTLNEPLESPPVMHLWNLEAPEMPKMPITRCRSSSSKYINLTL